MSANLFNDLIKKTSDYDKDQRFMATSDIINNLAKDVKIDEVLEKKICSAILKQLDDKSNDVQSVAVKCLGILVKKVHAAQITDICDKLCSLILDGQDALRDIYSIGLKTLISDIPEEHGAVITARLVNRLVFGIARVGADDIIKECLENMNDLIRRFGYLISNEHEDIMKGVIKQLVHDKQLIKKRAAICLGSLAVVLTDAQLNHLIELLLAQSAISPASKDNVLLETRTLIQTFGAISRTVGHRLGRHLDRLIPLFLKCCGDPNDENQQTAEANELREFCFLGLESFVLRCRREVTPFLTDVLGVSLEFMTYDPNYTYDEDNEGMDEEEYYDADDDYGGSDDDDGSWKVRKSAVKVVLAVIVSRPDLLISLYDQCADLLLTRFKDREETVRLDVIAAFNSLLQMSLSLTGNHPRKDSSVAASSPRTPRIMNKKIISSGSIATSEIMNILSKVKERVGDVVKASRSHFDGTSLKTKSALFSLLRSLINILKGDMDAYLNLFLGWVEASLQDKNQSLKIDALVFVRTLVDSYDHASLTPFLPRLLTIAMNACKDDWYKIIAEGLRVLASVIVVMRPYQHADDMDIVHDTSSYHIDEATAMAIYDIVLIRIEALDIDQEIKESSIATMGKLFSHIGDLLSSKLPAILAIFRKRLDNEVTRYATLHAILDIARSPLHLDVSSFTSSSIRDLALFLRQQSRSLKLHTLRTIDELLQSPSSLSISDMNTLLSSILQELAPMIHDNDLSLTHGGLKLVHTIIVKFPSCMSLIKVELYPKLSLLAASSVLQGHALHGLVDVYKALSSANSADLSYNMLFEDLYRKNVNASLTKQSAMNIAKCIAGITITAPNNIQTNTVDIFTSDLHSSSLASSTQQQLILFCIGEVGYHVKIDKNMQVKDMIIGCFDNDAEEVRGAAAYALGHLAMGAMPIFLPIVLESMDHHANARYQYLLLSSLREIIHLHVMEEKSFEAYLSAVLPKIQSLFHTTDDGLRSMVAECVGSLAILNSETLLPWLQSLLSQDSTDIMMKWTISSALRHTLSRPLPVNSSLWNTITSSIRSFLESLYDDDLEVRKSFLLLVNSAVHHNPQVIVDLINDFIAPKLFETLAFKQEKVVDLGPFKHKVDEGLPLRKAALTAIETILDTIPERLDVSTCLSLAAELLVDKDEVKLQTHQVIIKIAVFSPVVLSNASELFIDPLEKTAMKKSTATSGPEAERALELVRSSVRVALILSKQSEFESNRTWHDFVERLTKAGLTTGVTDV